MSITTENAQIERTMLGFEDHGIMTGYVFLKAGPYSVGYGGYCLGGEFAGEWIKGILKAVGVERWEDLKGKYCRLRGENTWGASASRSEIGHITEDRWFSQHELAQKFKETP